MHYDSGSESGPSPAAMAALWETMTQWFGQLWTMRRGTTPSEAWAFGLSGLSDDEVRRGLEALAGWRERFPPTLPEFRALCRPQNAGPTIAEMSDVELVEVAARIGVPSVGLSRQALERAVKAHERRAEMRAINALRQLPPLTLPAVLKEEEND